MIRFNEIRKKYGKIEVLKGVNLALNDSQVVALVGPNGSGKTTLMKTLLGLVIPDSGDIYINDRTVSKDFEYRRKIGFMPQISRFPENLRVIELFDMMKDLRHDFGNYDTELYDIYELDKISTKKLSALSGGTKQKVSAALAFLFRPEILILDEPTAGLDPMAREHLKDKILKVKDEGRLVIISSHLLSDIEELSNIMVYIFEGKIKFCLPINAMKEKTGEKNFNKAMARIIEMYHDN